MTSDIIEIWAGVLGLAYLAAAGLYFEMISAGKRSRVSASYGFGHHPGCTRSRSGTRDRNGCRTGTFPFWLPGGAVLFPFVF